jgi:hypothetical protein
MKYRNFSLVLFPILTACLALAQTSNTAPRNGAREYVFSVPAAQAWFDTNLDLQPGDRAHVVGGVIDCDGPRPTEKLDVPLPSAPVGALLAKLHADAAPIVATPDADLPVIDPSHLYLGVNGWRCSGKIPAKVIIQRRTGWPRFASRFWALTWDQEYSCGVRAAPPFAVFEGWASEL